MVEVVWSWESRVEAREWDCTWMCRTFTISEEEEGEGEEGGGDWGVVAVVVGEEELVVLLGDSDGDDEDDVEGGGVAFVDVFLLLEEGSLWSEDVGC